jgi:hypothetical protein
MSETANPRSRGGTVGASGRRRQLALAKECEAERKALEADIIAGLGRVPSALDMIAIETMTATAVRARRLRACGRSDHSERQLLVQATRATGLRPQPPVAAKVNPAAALSDVLSTWNDDADADADADEATA